MVRKVFYVLCMVPDLILRSSGKTVCRDETNLSIDVLANDLVQVLKEVFPDKNSNPDLILVGHSMVSFRYIH